MYCDRTDVGIGRTYKLKLLQAEGLLAVRCSGRVTNANHTTNNLLLRTPEAWINER